MRILINGVYIGGNCPPFYYHMKSFGNKIKICDALYFNKPYGDFSELIDKKDIIIPDYNKLDYYCYKLYQKTGVNFFLISIKRKIKRIIKSFKPDIIVNHQTSIRADLIRSTSFTPIVNVIYGSEIRGKNIFRKGFYKNLKHGQLTLTTINEARCEIIKQYKDIENKVKFSLTSLTSCKKIDDSVENYQPPNDDVIRIFDNRTLRLKELTYEVISGYISIAKENPNSQFIILKGFSGSQKNLEMAISMVKKEGVESNFDFYFEALPIKKYFKLLVKSNIITSFLPKDQIGDVIMHGMYLEKYLLLTDLPQYREILGDNAHFVNDTSKENIYKGILDIIKKMGDINLKYNKDTYVNYLDANTSFEKINAMLKQVISDSIKN